MALNLLLSAILLLILFQNQIICVNIKWNGNEILPPDYNRDEPPVINGQPVVVYVYMALLSLLPNSDFKMSFNADIFIHQYWEDNRLLTPPGMENTSSTITLSYQWRDRIWMPEIYFHNAVKGKLSDILSPSQYFTVTNGTQVFMAARFQMDLECNMDFRKYPFDEQTCTMKVTTLSETEEFVLLRWGGGGDGGGGGVGMERANHFLLPQFTINKITCTRCHNIYEFGTFSCIMATIQLYRNSGNFIIKRYIPSIIIVLMTFVGFWIPTTAYPARVALIITSLLALIAQQIQEELNVSYVYALEVWMLMCIAFVFATLIEFAVAIGWPIADQKATANQNILSDNNSNIANDDPKNFKTSFLTSFMNILKEHPRNSCIDMWSRILFPVVFAVAIIIYFLAYLL